MSGPWEGYAANTEPVADRPPDCQPTVEDLLAVAGLPPAGALEALQEAELRMLAAIAGEVPLWQAALGIRALLSGMAYGAHFLPEYDAERLAELSLMAAPALIDAAGEGLSKARIIDGLAVFRQFARRLGERDALDEQADVFVDRIHQVALLADEFDGLHRRRTISARGAPLARARAIEAAARAPAPAGRQ